MNDQRRGEHERGVDVDKPLLTTHVLDTSKGIPARGIAVCLYRNHEDEWILCKKSVTDTNGRCSDLATSRDFVEGRYKLRFGVGEYFENAKVDAIFPVVEIIFDVKRSWEHYHVPLLLSPFGFTTYRGS